MAAIVATTPLTGAADAASARTVGGQTVVKQLRRGRAVVLEDVRVRGALDLGGIRTVTSTFKCQRCTFSGEVHAPDVVFSRDVDMRRSRFVPSADFSGARFEGDASFDDAIFLGAARFDSTGFRAAAGFRNAQFMHGAGFASATFRRQADLSNANFEGADFSDARFGGGATYLEAHFENEAYFDRVSAGGDLDFTFALFAGRVLELRAATVAGTLSFEDTAFGILNPPPLHIDLAELKAARLVLAVDAVRLVEGPRVRRSALRLIESTANARGDTATANDAEYELRVLAADDYPRWLQLLDFIFYRGAAGYLLRPWRPLLVLTALVATVVAFRRYRRRSRHAEVVLHSSLGRSVLAGTRTARPRTKRLTRRAASFPAKTGDFLADFWDELAAVIPRRTTSAKPESPPLSRRLEILVYRVLFVCFLVALARANQGLREMINALT